MENGRLSAVMPPTNHTTFPVAEGVGIFVGIVAWNLFADGQLEIVKAALIAAPCALAWFGIRCWKDKSGKKQP